jgi:1-acyl-sn-glycerol-3-phosphate acyltransferase
MARAKPEPGEVGEFSVPAALGHAQSQYRAEQPGAVDELTRINLDDLVASLGWQGRPRRARVARAVFAGQAERFARHCAEFDLAVRSDGLIDAARAMLRRYVAGVEVFDREHVPSGPFLALSNHPGLCDALALFAALGRHDLKIIAARRRFLEALPNTSRHLSCLDDPGSARMAVMREVAGHLRRGGAALTFPAGRIEPDPDRRRGAAAKLADWSPSAGALLRLAPETPVLPVLVRGVVWPPADRLAALGRNPNGDERDQRAAALQLLAHTLLGVRSGTVRVQIGRPIRLRGPGPADVQELHAAVTAEMTRLFERPPQDAGVAVALAVAG